MGKLVIRPFVQEDFAALAHPGWQAGQGPAYTATVDDQVIGCAGVSLCTYAPWGTAWALLGPLGREYGRGVSRAVAAGLRGIIRDYGLVRVEAEVLADHALGRRWVDWLGFTEEGRMPLRGPNGATMIRYVLFPNPHADDTVQQWVERYTPKGPDHP